MVEKHLAFFNAAGPEQTSTRIDSPWSKVWQGVISWWLESLPRISEALMAKVTTGTGDAGYTGLLGGQRVAKYDQRIDTLGAVDEATSALGVARAAAQD